MQLLALSLGISIENMIKTHPDYQYQYQYQPDAPDNLKARRRVELGFKGLDAFVGTDEFVMNALSQRSKKRMELTCCCGRIVSTLMLITNKKKFLE